MNDSFISQGDYDLADEPSRDVVVETSADDTDVVVEPPEGDLPVADTDTTARMGQRVVSNAMEVTGAAEKETEAAIPLKTWKRKRNPTVLVEGVEHVIIPAFE